MKQVPRRFKIWHQPPALPKPEKPGVVVTSFVEGQHGPTIAEMIADFAGSMAALVADSFVSEAQFQRRLNEGCRKCPGCFWDEAARDSRGRCNGLRACSAVKLYRADEECPLKWWPEYRGVAT